MVPPAPRPARQRLQPVGLGDLVAQLFVRVALRDVGQPSELRQVARRQLLDARQSLRRPLTQADVQAAPAEQMRYTRTAANEVYRQFPRLPNPDLVMYVFPHLAGTDPVPVPGYSTVFPLYQRVQYAMPGERTEAY